MGRGHRLGHRNTIFDSWCSGPNTAWDVVLDLAIEVVNPTAVSTLGAVAPHTARDVVLGCVHPRWSRSVANPTVVSMLDVVATTRQNRIPRLQDALPTRARARHSWLDGHDRAAGEDRRCGQVSG